MGRVRSWRAWLARTFCRGEPGLSHAGHSSCNWYTSTQRTGEKAARRMVKAWSLLPPSVHLITRSFPTQDKNNLIDTIYLEYKRFCLKKKKKFSWVSVYFNFTIIKLLFGKHWEGTNKMTLSASPWKQQINVPVSYSWFKLSSGLSLRMTCAPTESQTNSLVCLISPEPQTLRKMDVYTEVSLLSLFSSLR